MNLTPWAFAILPLGVTRATQIVLFDRITDAPRTAIQRRLNPNGYEMEDPRRSYLSILFQCSWCMSVWVAAGFVAFTAWGTTRVATLYVAAVLSLSLVAVGIDRMFDRWLPDEAHTSTTLYGDGVSVTGPPGEVEDAFAELTGRDDVGGG